MSHPRDALAGGIMRPEQFNCPGPPSTTDAGKRVELRACLRLPAQKDLFCYVNLYAEQSIGPMRVRDLCTGGLSLILECPVGRGVAIPLRLYSKATKAWSQHVVRVVHVSEQPDGRFVLGGSFTRPLSDGELQAFL